MKTEKEWFEEWFDSPYYHILYKNRDSSEAETLLNNLISGIPMNAGSKVLDVACGKGRHSIHLNRMGFDVTGFDLSPRSIRHNLQFENETLQFAVHDMRNVLRSCYFDYAVNLFSSFGYFDQINENQRVFNAVATALKKGGIFIFDYVNVNWAIHHALGDTTEHIDGIEFKISKSVQGNFIEKNILFENEGKAFDFCERLRIFQPETLTTMINKAGLTVSQIYGDYQLTPFDPDQSKRVIIVALKK